MGEQKLFSKPDVFGNYVSRDPSELDGEDINMTDDGALWMLDNTGQYTTSDTQFSVVLGPLSEWNSQDHQFETFMFNSGFGWPEAIVDLDGEPGPVESRPRTPDLDRRSSSIDSGGEDFSFLTGTAGLPSVSPPASSVDVSQQAESRPPWLCAECNEQFRTSQNLESHARAAKHQAYVCKECKKGFPRRDTFVRHAAMHRPSGVHTCQICQSNNKETVFKRKDHLHQHERNIHPEMSQPIIRRRPGAIVVLLRPNTADHRTGNLRTDHYGSGDDLCPPLLSHDTSPAPPFAPTGRSSNSEEYWTQESQDVNFVLGSILGSTASAVQFIESPADMECASERVKLVRGLARLALLPPDQLPHKTKEQLHTLVQDLEEVAFFMTR